MLRHLLSLGLLFSAFIATARTEDPAPPLRVFYTGHSFHMFVPGKMTSVVKAGGVKEYANVGTQGIGGSRVIQHWDLAEDKNKAKKALIEGKVDLFTMAAHVKLPDEGIDHFVELGLKHNPKMRFLVQQSWMPFDGVEKPIKDNAERENTKLDKLRAEQEKWRGQIEEQARALNKKANREVVSIVPVGDAVFKLRELIAAGKLPGIEKHADLYTDSIGHGKAPILILATYCNYVCITGRNPVGLKVNDPAISEELHAILQKIAWETVSEYPMSGAKGKK